MATLLDRRLAQREDPQALVEVVLRRGGELEEAAAETAVGILPQADDEGLGDDGPDAALDGHFEGDFDPGADGLTVLENMSHRGARGSEPNTGDGAGILVQLPHAFFAAEAHQLGFRLPAPGEYGVGMVFLPKDAVLRRAFEARLEAIVAEEGQTLLGWRTVPTDNSSLGDTAKAGEPYVRQIFVGRSSEALVGRDALAFERKLYVIRKRAEQAIRYGDHPQAHQFYIASLSSRTIVYKVKRGDTLFKIAELFDTTVAKLKSWNQLHSGTLAVGTRLKIVR